MDGYTEEMETMKAVRCERFGDAPPLGEVPVPEPGAGEVRVRQGASSINAADWLIAQGRPWVARPAFAAMLRPPVLGRDVAGVVDAVGPGVADLAVGDAVMGEAQGAWAPYVRIAARGLARVPANVNLLAAAALPVAGRTALQGIRDAARVEPGQRVLIVGASGSVGHLAVQIAVSFGAEVTGVCSAAKADLVRGLGAHDVLDRRTDDYTARRGAWDAIFDLAGDRPLSACLGALRSGGVYVSSAGTNGGLALGPLPRLLRVAVRSLFDRRLRVLATQPSTPDLVALGELVASGTLRPSFGETVALDGVPAALGRFGAGEVRGKCGIQFC